MSNKQNEIIRETAYDADCEDMAMWALANQIEMIFRDMQKDRLKMTAQKIELKAQQRTIDLMSERIDKIMEVVCLLSNVPIPTVTDTKKKK